MLHATSLCDCYMSFNHRLLLEMYLRKLKGRQRIQLSQIRGAPYTSPRARERITDSRSQGCPFCCKECKADEYHLILVCENLRDKWVELVWHFSNLYPNKMKFDQLIDSVNNEFLKKAPFYAISSVKFVPMLLANYLFVICTPLEDKLLLSNSVKPGHSSPTQTDAKTPISKDFVILCACSTGFPKTYSTKALVTPLMPNFQTLGKCQF